MVQDWNIESRQTPPLVVYIGYCLSTIYYPFLIFYPFPSTTLSTYTSYSLISYYLFYSQLGSIQFWPIILFFTTPSTLLFTPYLIPLCIFIINTIIQDCIDPRRGGLEYPWVISLLHTLQIIIPPSILYSSILYPLFSFNPPYPSILYYTYIILSITLLY